MKKYSILVLTLILSYTSWSHPLKLSYTKMSIESNGDVKLKIKLFLDDLTIHIENTYCIENPDFLDINSEGIALLQKYLNEHLFITQHNLRTDFNIKGVSLSEDNLALVVNLDGNSPIDKDNAFTLNNTVLCDAFKNQLNIVKYYKLNKQFTKRFPTFTYND